MALRMERSISQRDHWVSIFATKHDVKRSDFAAVAYRMNENIYFYSHIYVYLYT